MARKFFVINFLISLVVWGITAAFALNDDIYGWSDRLATIMLVHSLLYITLYNVKGLNYWKTESKKGELFWFGFFNVSYSFILFLFCKDHLAPIVSEALLQIIMLLIAATGGTVLWIYTVRFNRLLTEEKTQNKNID